MTSERDFEAFVNGYVTAMIWANTTTGEGDDNRPADLSGSEHDDVTPEALEQMREDCQNFLDMAGIIPAYPRTVGEYSRAGYSDAELAGHDFALTRNRHGAGFWDRGLGLAGDLLSEYARSFGEANLFLEEDGTIIHE